jgi:hypothetical protein
MHHDQNWRTFGQSLGRMDQRLRDPLFGIHLHHRHREPPLQPLFAAIARLGVRQTREEGVKPA